MTRAQRWREVGITVAMRTAPHAGWWIRDLITNEYDQGPYPNIAEAARVADELAAEMLADMAELAPIDEACC